ncbi:MAG: YkgJ family cysteine cluster protein [Myxococcaceae bacterium]
MVDLEDFDAVDDRPEEGPAPHAIRASILEVRAIYRHADALYAPYSCPASGECCQLSTTKRQPWLWRPEWEALLARLAREKRPVPPGRSDGGCPFLDAAGKRCTVYADRPLGCRTFFCGRRSGPAREPLEEMVRLSQRLEAVSRELDPELTSPRPIFEWLGA